MKKKIGENVEQVEKFYNKYFSKEFISPKPDTSQVDDEEHNPDWGRFFRNEPKREQGAEEKLLRFKWTRFGLEPDDRGMFVMYDDIKTNSRAKEITDEQIKTAAENYASMEDANRQHFIDASSYDGFVDGIDWYRNESKK